MPLWPAEQIWQSVTPALPDFSIEILPEIDSTNTELMRRSRAGRTEPVLLLAERQTAGRGRLGRDWRSDVDGSAASSLTFSLGLALAPADWSGLSLVAGIAVAEALDPRIGLKWPNDLWWQDRKLGGILVETGSVGLAPGAGLLSSAPQRRRPTLPTVQGGSARPHYDSDEAKAVARTSMADASLRYVVIGVGLNIGLPPAGSSLAPALRTPPACLQELIAGIDAASALGRVALPLVAAALSFAADGFAPWQARFEARDVLAGRVVRMGDGVQGRAAGVDARGALLLQTSAGTIEAMQSSEASVRPLADD